MAVEPRLAHPKLDPASEPARHALDLGAYAVEPVARMRGGARDSGRRAIFAEDLAQCRAPLTGRHAGLRAFDRCRQDVAALLRGGSEAFERRSGGARIAARPPGLQTLDLFGLDFLRNGE